jgi:hypothetical protein
MRMKRFLFVSVLVAAMAVPSAAISSTQGFSSSVAKRGGPPIHFTVVTVNGKPRKVKNFSYNDIPLTCDVGGPVSASGSGIGTAPSGPNGPAKVENGEFSKRYLTQAQGGGDGSFKVVGEFKKHNTRVVGTFKVKGDFDSISASGCRSGPVNYLAT